MFNRSKREERQAGLIAGAVRDGLGLNQPQQQVPPTVAALLQRKSIALKGKEPMPGTVDEVIARRFDRWIREEYKRLGLAVPDSFNES